MKYMKCYIHCIAYITAILFLALKLKCNVMYRTVIINKSYLQN